MRRLYVLPKAVFSGQIQVGIHHDASAQPVASPGVPVTPAPANGTPIFNDVIQLFHPLIGSHYIDLPNGMILLCTSFDHNEQHEDLFHSHPEVAILPHPTLDGNLPLAQHSTRAAYKFAAKHLKALVDSPDLGVLATDSVLDVARKAAAVHPEVKFRHTL